MIWTVVRPRMPQDRHRVWLRSNFEHTEAVWDSEHNRWEMKCSVEGQRDLALHHGWKLVDQKAPHDFTSLLEKTVDQIKDELPNLVLDAQELDQLAALESSGQKRKGVRKAIQQARRALERD